MLIWNWKTGPDGEGFDSPGAIRRDNIRAILIVNANERASQ